MFSPSIISRASSRHSQHGVIGIWGSMTLLLAVMFMALAVDTGRLWMQQRKLQSIADIASMEAARAIGCSADSGSVLSAAQAAAARNGYSGQLSQNPNVVELGSVTTVSGIREFSNDSEQEAVRVMATESVPASLIAGGLFGNQVVLHAEAVSSADPSLVAFTVGTSLLSVNSDQAFLMSGLLGNLLGSSINIDAASYEDLAAVNLNLANLMQVHGASTMEELLESEMALGSLLNLIVASADAETVDGTASGALLELSSGITNNSNIKLSDILVVSAPDENTAADLRLNVFSLISAAALFANEGNTVPVPVPLTLTLPGTNINAGVSVTQAPLLAVGPSVGNGCTEARTAQLMIAVTASVPLVDVGVNVEVAPGRAELVEFVDDGSESHIVIAATPGIANVEAFLSLPLGLELEIPLDITMATAQEMEFDVAHPVTENLPQTMSVSSSLTGSLGNALEELGVSSITNSLLGALGNLLDPLLEMLGIRLGGMDVTLHDIQLRQARPLII